MDQESNWFSASIDQRTTHLNLRQLFAQRERERERIRVLVEVRLICKFVTLLECAKVSVGRFRLKIVTCEQTLIEIDKIDFNFSRGVQLYQYIKYLIDRIERKNATCDVIEREMVVLKSSNSSHLEVKNCKIYPNLNLT